MSTQRNEAEVLAGKKKAITRIKRGNLLFVCHDDTIVIAAGCRQGRDVVEFNSDANSIAGVLSVDRGGGWHVVGEISSGELI